MSRPRDRRTDDKFGSLPVVWQIRPAQRGSDDKFARTSRICHLTTAALVGPLPPTSTARERALSGLAGLQRGVVTRQQLLSLGFSGSAIDRRIARAALHPIFPGVYVVGHDARAALAVETAALLYLGDDCVLSHSSAAALWHLAPPPSSVTLTRVGGSARRHRKLVVHRVDAIHISDVTIHLGLPATAPARVLLDFAAEAATAELERALAEARVQGLVSDSALKAAIDRAPRRTGSAKLSAVLSAERSPAMTRSEIERALRRLVSAAGLPEPLFNHRIGGLQVDAIWLSARLVVEVDGYRFHGHRAAFERDRRRDQTLAAAGYTVIRITWRQLREEPIAVAVRLAQALARRRDVGGDGA